MKKIALVGSIGNDNIADLISDIKDKLKDKEKASIWWSYPIKHCKEDYEREKPFWFYFYQDGKLKARCKVVDFITHEGDDGIECPRNWEDFILDERWKGKKKLSERKNEIFKTWLLIDEIEKLNEYIPLKDLKSFCNRRITPVALKNGFLYIQDPILTSDALKKLVADFIKQSIEKDTLKTDKYKFFYRNLRIKVSFGQGNQSKVSWMAFLGKKQEVSKGIYPVLLFNRKDCLVLAFGISEEQEPEIKWNEKTTRRYPRIENSECKCNLRYIKEKYPNSFLKLCIKISNKKIAEENLNTLIQNLDEIIDEYLLIFSTNGIIEKNISLKQPIKSYNALKNKKTCIISNLKLENHQIASFYNALKTKGFVILAGLSGTGKTKIFEEFVRCFPKPKIYYIIDEIEEANIEISEEEINNLSEKKLSKIIKSFWDETEYFDKFDENLREKLLKKAVENLINVYFQGNKRKFQYFVKENKEDEMLKENTIENHIFISIRPDFKDSRSLLGYFNPITGKFHSTPLLKFILKAQKNYFDYFRNADPFFILFDEMNLARVEYYFADFLSVLESKRITETDIEKFIKDDIDDSRWKKNLGFSYPELEGFTSQSIKLHSEGFDIRDNEGNLIPEELFLPPNLYFIGTVNIDETTHIFSPKVLDRAFTIEFDVGCFDEYLDFLKSSSNGIENKSELTEDFKKDFTNDGNFASIDKEKVLEFLEKNKKYKDELEKINQILKPFNLHFGYRVFDEIIMFLYNCQNSLIPFENLDEAFDLALKMKVLPKFHGTRQKLKKPILRFLNFCEIKSPEELIKEGIPDLNSIDSDYKHTAHKLLEMLYKLQTQGFASFM
ncbi:MrcB family domain-containing protein [Persephonella sp.]